MNGLARAFLADIGFQLELLGAVLVRLRQSWHRRGLIADQLYQAGIRVVHVVLLVGLFIGMIVSLQTGIELAKIGPQFLPFCNREYLNGCIRSV